MKENEEVKERKYECSTILTYFLGDNNKVKGIDMLSSSENSPSFFDLA
ncbi:hypothetical protein [Peribacillus frigoritolerans]|nr:hypothetical protein [Peribacillus frigoritolerans]